MHGRIYFTRFMSYQLHNIYLTTGRPAAKYIVLRQHPQRRPDTFAFWKFGSYINTSVFKYFLTARYDLARCIILSAKRFLSCFDQQLTILEKKILRATGIILEFII